MAVRGDDPLKIKQRAGHSSFSTTEIYIREAEAVREGFGQPFPPLPGCLLESPRNRPGRLGGPRSGQKQGVSSGADENRTPRRRFRETQAERGLDLQPLEITPKSSSRSVPLRSVPDPRWLHGHGNLTATESAAI